MPWVVNVGTAAMHKCQLRYHTEFLTEERCFLLLVLLFFQFEYFYWTFRTLQFGDLFSFLIRSLYLKHIQVLCCYHDMIHVAIITFQEQLGSFFFKCRYAVVCVFIRSHRLHDAVLNWDSFHSVPFLKARFKPPILVFKMGLKRSGQKSWENNSELMLYFSLRDALSALRMSVGLKVPLAFTALHWVSGDVPGYYWRCIPWVFF